MTICDRCQVEITNDGGYCVYSESKIMGMLIGTLLLCENCANRLFTNEIWKKATQTVTEIDMSTGFEKVMEAQRQAADFSIAMRAKRRGFNAVQARQEAREIAKLWWTDKEAAQQQLLETKTNKNWWQFWK